MLENANEVINKGIPVDTPVVLLSTDILNLCSNKNIVRNALHKQLNAFMCFLDSKVDYYPNIQMFQTLGIVQDKDNISKKLCFSVTAVISTIIYNLNITKKHDGHFINGEELGEFLLDRETGCRKYISDLRKVSTEKRLSKNFPMLYQTYLRAMENQKKAKEFKDFLLGSSLTFEQKKQIRKRLVEEAGSKESLDRFLKLTDIKLNPEVYANACADLFTYMIDNLDEVMDFLNDHPIDLSSLSDEDVKRFELYVAYQHLQYAESVSLESKQRYLYYVSNYLLELGNDVDDDLEIVVDKYESNIPGISDREGYVVTQRMLKERYKQLLIDYPELKAVTLNKVDFSTMKPEEVEEFMKDYLKDLSANWEMIPDGKSLDDFFATSISRKTRKMSEEEKIRYRERLTDLYLEKKTFHESLDPFCTLRGLDTFDGYVAYVHSNGKIVLEKYFENASTGRVSTGDAIYIMDSEDFHRLSQLSKRELIESKSCKRIIHRGDWQSRVLEEISDTTDTSKVDLYKNYKELVKTGAITGFDSSKK